MNELQQTVHDAKKWKNIVKGLGATKIRKGKDDHGPLHFAIDKKGRKYGHYRPFINTGIVYGKTQDANT